jgi:hypothetical protein
LFLFHFNHFVAPRLLGCPLGDEKIHKRRRKVIYFSVEWREKNVEKGEEREMKKKTSCDTATRPHPRPAAPPLPGGNPVSVMECVAFAPMALLRLESGGRPAYMNFMSQKASFPDGRGCCGLPGERLRDGGCGRVSELGRAILRCRDCDMRDILEKLKSNIDIACCAVIRFAIEHYTIYM